jgi:hypothetical protein
MFRVTSSPLYGIKLLLEADSISGNLGSIIVSFFVHPFFAHQAQSVLVQALYAPHTPTE